MFLYLLVNKSRKLTLFSPFSTLLLLTPNIYFWCDNTYPFDILYILSMILFTGYNDRIIEKLHIQFTNFCTYKPTYRLLRVLTWCIPPRMMVRIIYLCMCEYTSILLFLNILDFSIPGSVRTLVRYSVFTYKSQSLC